MADRTDTVLIRVIDGEVVDSDATRQIPAPWLRPPVTRVYRRRPSRWDTFRRSQFAADLRAAAQGAFWTAVVGCGLLLAVAARRAFPTVTADQLVTAVCLAVPLLSVYGLWRLSDPTSRLSRYVDADVTPEEIR